jgi:hypothetical protein
MSASNVNMGRTDHCVSYRAEMSLRSVSDLPLKMWLETCGLSPNGWLVGMCHGSIDIVVRVILFERFNHSLRHLLHHVRQIEDSRIVING